MPIKPENKHLYPREWPAISRKAKERAGWHCAHPGCLARQYAVGFWSTQTWIELWRADGAETMPGAYGHARQRAAEEQWRLTGDEPQPDPKVIVIVLTTAHLNHDPSDCSPSNLAPLCQRHHLRLDAEHHTQTAYMTRRERACTGDLFTTDPSGT